MRKLAAGVLFARSYVTNGRYINTHLLSEPIFLFSDQVAAKRLMQLAFNQYLELIATSAAVLLTYYLIHYFDWIGTLIDLYHPRECHNDSLAPGAFKIYVNRAAPTHKFCIVNVWGGGANREDFDPRWCTRCRRGSRKVKADGYL